MGNANVKLQPELHKRLREEVEEGRWDSMSEGLRYYLAVGMDRDTKLKEKADELREDRDQIDEQIEIQQKQKEKAIQSVDQWEKKKIAEIREQAKQKRQEAREDHDPTIKDLQGKKERIQERIEQAEKAEQCVHSGCDATATYWERLRGTVPERHVAGGRGRPMEIRAERFRTPEAACEVLAEHLETTEVDTDG